MRVCTTSDFEYTNISLGKNSQCEVDLKAVNGFCRNDKRNQLQIRNPNWEGWASENQLLSISKDSPINFITWPAAHNAFSNVNQGFNSGFYTNHGMTITDLLNFGMRHLELDPKEFQRKELDGSVTGDLVMRLCHSNETWRCQAVGYGNRLLGMALIEIANWLDANPGQVVYIKLDNRSIYTDLPKLEIEVSRYLGNRVYPVPATFTRWPTIQEIRNAGKSVIVARHNTDYNLDGSSLIWSAIGLVQTSNHPNDQNFDTCTANDGFTPYRRSIDRPTSWWDVAEGRARTNTDSVFSSSATGFLWEGDVAKAANCGVSVIGMDFVNTLDSNLNVSPRSGPDNRLKETIWSWSKDDYGRNGPAYQDKTSGAWVSFNASAVLPLACALKRPYGSPLQDRGWKITSQSYAWNPGIGDLRCSQEFDTATEKYEFSHPYNGWQNKKLWEAAAGRKVWLNYSVVPVSNASLSTNSLVYRMNPGGNPPPAQTVRIGAAPGTKLEGKLVGTLPLVFSLPSSPFANGQYDLSIGFGPTVSSLAPGDYQGSIDMLLTPPDSTVGESVSVSVKLTVKRLPILNAFPDRTTQTAGAEVVLTAQLLDSSNPTGGLKFYRILDANGRSTGQETVAADTLAPGNTSIKPRVTNLPLGRNTYMAVYPGDNNHTAVESEPFTVTILPRILPTPESLTFSGIPSAPPADQVVTLTGLGASPVVDNPSCAAWLRADLVGSTLTVGMRSGFSSLNVSGYNCPLTVRDALTGQGGGSTVIPVQVFVQTTLTAQPGSVTLFGAKPAAVDVVVSAVNGRNLALTLSSPQSWIFGEIQGGSANTPAQVKVTVDPTTLPLGLNTGQLVITTPLAATLTIPVSFTKVNETVVTSSPVGLVVTVDGANYTTPASFVWQPGTSHSISAPTPQLNGGTRYKFTGLGGASSPYVAVNGGGTITANFSTEYLLSSDAVPSNGGSVTRSPFSADSYYAPGTVVQLTALPANNYSFAGYSGDATGTNVSASVAMSGPRSVVATFSQIQPVSVTITSATPNAAITVNGTFYTLPASLLWTPGTTYQLSTSTSFAGAGGVQYVFQSWSNSASPTQSIVAPNTPLNLVLTHRRQYLLTASAFPQVGGTVTGGGWYDEGTSVQVQAQASSGYGFSNFSGDVTGTTNPATVVLNAPRSVVANFAPSGTPRLTLLTGGTRTDGPVAGQRFVPIIIRNGGDGTAVNLRITGVTGITTLLGTGTVNLLSPTPLNLGNLSPTTDATPNLLFDWPATAQRVRLTINYAYDNGAPGSMTLTILR